MARLPQRLRLSPGDADAHLKQALAFYNRNNLTEAITHVGQAIDLLPTNAEYFATRGLFYLEHGMQAESLKDKRNADRSAVDDLIKIDIASERNSPVSSTSAA